MIVSGPTVHAATRLQQRSIPTFIVELLERFGTSMRCSGAERLFFDKASKRRLRRHFGGDRGLRAIERWLTVYVVIGDNGQIITAARQLSKYSRP